MGSIIGHRIDYNGAEAYTQQKLTQIPPPPREINLSRVLQQKSCKTSFLDRETAEQATKLREVFVPRAKK